MKKQMKPIRPHRCFGCEQVGRLSLADPQPNDPRPVLKISWGPTGAALTCPSCTPPQTRK
jgi:hypothetical protein